MGLRDLIARLTGTAGSADGALPPQLEALLPELIDLVADEVEPNLRSLPRFAKRIEPAVRKTIMHLRELGQQFPQVAVDLSAAAWSGAVEVNTLFATAADVTATLARSDDLQRWFRDRPGALEAYAWLGAERHERSVLGMALNDGASIQRDVMQTTLSFDQQRVVLPADSVASARIELAVAVFRGLLGIVLASIEASRAQSKGLAERKAMLKVRLNRLKQQRQSIACLTTDAGATTVEIAAVERELAQAGAELTEAKQRFTTLDTYLPAIQQVLERPADVLSVIPIAVRVDRMGVCVDAQYTGPVNELTLLEIRARDFQRVAVLVRCDRADLPARPDTRARYGIPI